MNNNDEDIIILWEAPKILPTEYRLYYEEDTGKVLFYTCEKPEGKYIVIDSLTYAAGRPDIRVINGKISTVKNNCVVSKLMPDKEEGQACEADDISVVSIDTTGIIRWKLNTYELK